MSTNHKFWTEGNKEGYTGGELKSREDPVLVEESVEFSQERVARVHGVLPGLLEVEP